jgi:hypothetical protein
MDIFQVRSLELLLVGFVYSRGAVGVGHVSCGRFVDVGEGFESEIRKSQSRCHFMLSQTICVLPA